MPSGDSQWECLARVLRLFLLAGGEENPHHLPPSMPAGQPSAKETILTQKGKARRRGKGMLGGGGGTLVGRTDRGKQAHTASCAPHPIRRTAHQRGTPRGRERECRDGCPTQLKHGRARSPPGGTLVSRLESASQLQKSCGLSAPFSLSAPVCKETEPYLLPA